jgi:dTDP-4-dehydrorhamnose reductase
MRAMLLGAGGMLGHDLAATVPSAVTLLTYSKAQLDITDAEALAATVATVKPDVIINAAAYTAVDRAETERDLAFRVNAEAVATLGRIARSNGARVIHFSTDYVFDGEATEPYTEESPTNPVNMYGASKLAGEHALRQSEADALIIRTQWLFGVHGKSFPRTMRDRALARVPSKVVSDQVGRPTHSRDVARATWHLEARKEVGVIHVTNDGTATWYDVAKRVYAACHAPTLVQACSTAEFPRPARRPASSILATERLAGVLGESLPPWEDALAQFLAETPVGG